MASGLNLKVAQKAYNSVKKDIATLDDYINEFRKNVVILNETIWYGGKAADTWYASANKAYAADCKFRDKLINIQNRLATKIDKTIAASGGKDRVTKMSASSGGGGSVGGAGAVASYSSGGSVSGSGSTGGSASGANNTSGKTASKKMSNDEQERANRENTSKAIENGKKSRAVAQQNKLQSTYDNLEYSKQSLSANASDEVKKAYAAGVSPASSGLSYTQQQEYAEYRNHMLSIEKAQNNIKDQIGKLR